MHHPVHGGIWSPSYRRGRVPSSDGGGRSVMLGVYCPLGLVGNVAFSGEFGHWVSDM